MSLGIIISLFVISGHKSILLGYILVYLVYFVFEKNKFSVRPIQLFYPFLFLLLFGVTIYKIFNIDSLLNIFVRRTMHVPGILSGFYYEFFTENQKTYLSYSILKFINENPYSVNPNFLIGDYYFGRIDMSANVNYIMSGYGDFGWAGSIVVTIIVTSFYKFMDQVCLYKDNLKFGILLSVLPTWALVNSAFPTVLITHGLMLIFICFIIMPNSNKILLGNK